MRVFQSNLAEPKNFDSSSSFVFNVSKMQNISSKAYSILAVYLITRWIKDKFSEDLIWMVELYIRLNIV